MSSVIDPSLAKGLRRWYVQQANERLRDNKKKALAGKDEVFLSLLRRENTLLHDKPRRPSRGLPRGYDAVYVDHDAQMEDFLIIKVALDKRGDLIDDLPSRVFLNVSRHAVESLYQRLRTKDVKIVFDEMRPIGRWFMENAEAVAMEAEGLLLTMSGVFLIVRGRPFKTKELDGRYHWVATTWIADAGLEEHTSGKRHVAQAVRAARSAGLSFCK